MQITEVLREGLKREYKITVTAHELDDKVDEKLAEAQPNFEMKGFRKGRVPMGLLKKQFGERLRAEAMQEVVDGAVRSHFDTANESPARQPNLEMKSDKDVSEGNDLEVGLSYEAIPEIPEYDFSQIKLERLTVKPETADIAEALDKLAADMPNFKERGKTAKAHSGDQVVLDFVGRLDGEAFEGGSGEDFPLVLGSGSFIEGFEEQLEGVKKGDEKEVTVTFPDQYNAAHLAGKEAVFSCTIKSVNAPEKAALDDELAKKLGAEDLDKLKEQISEGMSKEYTEAAQGVLRRHLMDALDGAFDFELPESLHKEEANQIAHQLWHEDNPDVKGHDHPKIEPTKEHEELAARRVRLGLLLSELGKKNKITVSDSEVEQALFAQARQYPGHEQQFIEFARKNPNMRQQVEAPLFENKVIDHILDLVSVKDKAVKKATLEKAIKALDDES